MRILLMSKKEINLVQKFDLLTGEELEFKSIEQYSLQFFKNKRNMKKYFALSKDNGHFDIPKKFIFDIYKQYKELKKLQFSPHFVETLSIKCLPNVLTVNEYYPGGYSKLISDLEFESFLKYNNLAFPDLKNIPSDIQIIQDTREQKPIKTEYKTITKKLDFGDYTLDRENQTVFLERKSNNDFISSVSSNNNFERFCREIERARKANKYIIILVESKFSNVFYANNFLIRKVNSDFIGHRMRDLCRKFPKNLQIVFCAGRKEAAKLIPYFLYFDKGIINYDLQFAYHQNLITI